MAKVRLKGKKFINKVVSHEEGVKAAVFDQATAIAARAEARLNMAKHRTGASQIKLEQGRVDSYVTLDDPAAMQIEFGHWLVYYGHETPVYIPGLYVLTGAAGLA
jgi:hypothetical protein